MKKINLIKKIISLILIAAMICPTLPVTAGATETGEQIDAVKTEVQADIEETEVQIDTSETEVQADSASPGLTLSISGGELCVDYTGSSPQAYIIVGAYDSNGRAVSFETATMNSNTQSKFTYNGNYSYKAFALEPGTYKPICDAATEISVCEGTAEVPFLDDALAQAMTTAVSAYMTANADLDEVMALDFKGLKNDKAKADAAAAKLEKATAAYEEVLKAGAVLSRVAETETKKDQAKLNALGPDVLASGQVAANGATQDEQLHWAKELTKTYDSIQGNKKCQALGEMMGCDAKRAYQQLCMAQHILEGHYYDEESDVEDAVVKRLTLIKGTCKVVVYAYATWYTLGASAAAAAPLYGSAGYGYVTIGEAAGITIGGLDTFIEIVNDGAVLLSGRDTRIAEAIEKSSKPFSEACFIYSVLTGGGGTAPEKVACLGDIHMHLQDYGVYKAAGSVVDTLTFTADNKISYETTLVGPDKKDSFIKENSMTESEHEALKKQSTEEFTQNRPVTEEKLTSLLENGGDLKEGESLKTVTDEFSDTVGQKIADEDGLIYTHKTEAGKDYKYSSNKYGVPVGLYQVFDHATGQLLEEHYYDENGTYVGEKEINGVIPTYDSDGNLIREEYWKEGKLLWKKYYDPKIGKQIKEEQYGEEGNLISVKEWGYDSKTGRLESEGLLTDEYVGECRVYRRTAYYTQDSVPENTVYKVQYRLYAYSDKKGLWVSNGDYYGYPWYDYYENGNTKTEYAGEGDSWHKMTSYYDDGTLGRISEYIVWAEDERIKRITDYYKNKQIKSISYYRYTPDVSGFFNNDTEWYAESWKSYDEEGNLTEETIGKDDFWTEKNGYDRKGVLTYYWTHNPDDGSSTVEGYYTTRPKDLPFDPTGHLQYKETYTAEKEKISWEEWDVYNWTEEEDYVDEEGYNRYRVWKVWGYIYYDHIKSTRELQELGRELESDSGQAKADPTRYVASTVVLKPAAAAMSVDAYLSEISAPDAANSALPVINADSKGKYTFELTNGVAGKSYAVMVLRGKLDAFPSDKAGFESRLLYMDQKTIKADDRSFTLMPKSGYEATVFVTGDGYSLPVPAAYLAENHNLGGDEDDEKEMPYEIEPGDNPYENDENIKYPDGIWIAGVVEPEYSGMKIAISPRVYFRSKRLKEGVDYTISYKRNVDVYTLKEGMSGFDKDQAPVALIKLKGDFTGEAEFPFVIKPRNIAGTGFTVEPVFFVYNGEVQRRAPVLKWKGNTLKYGTDFYAPELDDIGFRPVGKESGNTVYKLTLTGKGNFTGTRTVEMTIAGAKTASEAGLPVVMMDKVTVSKIPNQGPDNVPVTFTNLKDGKGKACVPSVTYNGKTLEEDKDYSVDFIDNDAAGTATLILTGLNAGASECGASFVGRKMVTFKINGIPIGKASVEGTAKNGYPYTGREIRPDELAGFSLTYKKSKTETVTLKKDTDYSVSYEKNKNAGSATLLITGKGIYTGVKKQTFKITPVSIEGDAFSVSLEEVSAYKKGGVKPAVTVTEKASGRVLAEGTDYTLSYSGNNKLYTSADKAAGKSGQPSVAIKGKGNYKGKRTAQFLITARSILSGILFAAGDVAYTGKPGINNKNLVIMDKTTGQSLKAGSDYDKTITYTYWKDTSVTQKVKGKEVAISRAAGEDVDKNDILPLGAVIEAGIKGKGCYTDDIHTTFSIIDAKKDIGKAVLVIDDQEYAAKPVTITDMSQFKKDNKGVVQAYLKNGREIIPLTLGTDFKVVPGSYVNNTAKGTAKVTLAGMGGYGGMKTVNFKIVQRKMYWQVLIGGK